MKNQAEQIVSEILKIYNKKEANMPKVTVSKTAQNELIKIMSTKQNAKSKLNAGQLRESAKMQKPSVGRIVHYHRPGSADGLHKPEVSPAIITKVISDETFECQLFVMNPNGVYFNTTKFSEIPKASHWSWPVRD